MTHLDTVRRIVGPTILLASGEYFDFDDPAGSLFNIGDIARGLSHICRFAGQSPRFYSVAEHSVHVSRIVPEEHALAGLMHDAAEAFVGDMAKPLKVMCPDYQAIEKRVEAAVLDRFGIAMPLDRSIKEADIRMLATEQAQLMKNSDDWNYTHGRPVVDGLTIECLPPDDAFNLFIARFEELTGQPCGISRIGSRPLKAWPDKLTPELRALLGLMCFQLGGPAHAYRNAGEYEGIEGPLKGRAEDEQAFMLHKLLGFWFADPKAWAEKARDDLHRVCGGA